MKDHDRIERVAAPSAAESAAPLDSLSWTPQRFLRRHAARATRRKRMRRLTLTGVLVLLTYGFVVADGGLLHIVKRRAQAHRLEREVASLEARKAWLEEEIERRKSDPQTIERIAREQFGMTLPGETLYRIVEVSEERARRLELKRDERARVAGARAESTSSHAKLESP